MTTSAVALDSWTHQVLRSELPGLDAAFDEARVRGLLTDSLFRPGHRDRTLVRCTRTQAVFDAGPGCVVRYAVDVRHARTGGVAPALVLLRLFPGVLAARQHHARRLRPLAQVMRGRPEVAVFDDPVAIFEAHAMTASVFPIDGDLPALVAATDPATVLAALRDTLAPADVGFVPSRCRIEVAHYPRQHHCVLRYALGGDDSAGERVVYGKIAGDDRGRRTMAAVPELQSRLAARRGRRFAVPRALGIVPPLQLVLIEAVAGAPRIGALLKARLRGAPDAAPAAATARQGVSAAAGALEDAIDWAAGIAAALHDSGVAQGEPRRLAEELGEMRAGLDLLDRISPVLAEEFRDWVEAVAACAARTEAWPAVFSHGDFTPSQIFFSDEGCALIDFDTVCRAEPMLDLGQFLAHVRLVARKAGGPGPETAAVAERLCSRFLAAYVRERGLGPTEAGRLADRVRPYEMMSLLRLVLHSWRKFKPERLARAIALVRERLPGLGRKTS